MYARGVKRILDLIISGLGIIVFMIPMLVIAVIIKIDSPGPLLFRQKRIGIHKRIFTIVKFRSMPVSISPDTPTHLQRKDIKLTKWQVFLRKSSIDELPQLYCIFSGKMSLVGPRPALWNQDDLVAERDKYGANDVKPGLTGWAQINGRDNISIEDKAKLDGVYAAALRQGGAKGFKMDLKCFFGSFMPVIMGKDIS